LAARNTARLFDLADWPTIAPDCAGRSFQSGNTVLQKRRLVLQIRIR
jgi:hypothetical protein